MTFCGLQMIKHYMMMLIYFSPLLKTQLKHKVVKIFGSVLEQFKNKLFFSLF